MPARVDVSASSEKAAPMVGAAEARTVPSANATEIQVESHQGEVRRAVDGQEQIEKELYTGEPRDVPSRLAVDDRVERKYARNRSRDRANGKERDPPPVGRVAAVGPRRDQRVSHGVPQPTNRGEDCDHIEDRTKRLLCDEDGKRLVRTRAFAGALI
eukprot:4012528-Prymnesium_polylepis.2